MDFMAQKLNHSQVSFSGDLVINKVPVSNSEAFKEKIGYVTAQRIINPLITVEENFRFVVESLYKGKFTLKTQKTQTRSNKTKT